MIPTVIKNNEIDNIIQAFFKKFQMFTISKAFYLDRSSHFDNHKLQDFLFSRNVIVVYASSNLYKFVRQIEKTNNIL